MVDFKDLNLETKIETAELKVNDTTSLEVRKYLPMSEKIAVISYVVDNSLDENTGRFSAIRTGLFFDLAIAHYYGGISFGDDVNALEAYDALETSGVLNGIVALIPESEYQELSDLVEETTRDIADYNSSFAGILRMASSEASELDNKTTELINKVKSKDGLEILEQIKNVAGKD